mgnify:CR=1 FL=1
MRFTTWNVIIWTISALVIYFFWQYVILIGLLVLMFMFPGKSSKSTKYKPYKFKAKPRKRIVYKAPRIKKEKPRNKGRRLKDGQVQHMRTFGSKRYWTPKSRWQDRPD